MSIENATQTVEQFIAENADIPIEAMMEKGVEAGYSLYELRAAATAYVMGPIDLGMVGA